jgi:hypothetical protein
MSSSAPATPEAELAPPQSFPSRFLGVFISPVSTFQDIARKPDFLYPLIVLVICSVAVTETMLAKIGMERIVRNSLEQGGQAARMTAEQLQQAVERGGAVAGVIAHVMGVLGAPIFILIVAAIGLGILNGLFGTQLRFKTVFSVSCYANLVGVLSALMVLGVILGGDPERFNANNPAPTNLGFFLNPLETSKPLLTFASSIDLFTIWFLVLLGMGLSEATRRKVKPLSISLIFFGLWMVWVLGKVGIAMLT